MEEGKCSGVPVRLYQSRPLPLRLLQIFLAFLVLALGVSIISMFTIRYLGVQNVATTAKTNIIMPCFEKPHPDDLESLIRPPLNAEHKMNDSVLFWRASFVPQIKEYPFNRTQKIAFMFLTKGPLPLAPLWERFFKGHEGLYSIYIHSFPFYVPNFPPSSVFYDRDIPSQFTDWGRISMCDAERRLLANALLDINNEWFILLSESCIPLLNFSIIYRYISGSRYSFMASVDDHGPFGRGRYNPRMHPEVTLEQWRKGSQWFEVNRRLATNIISDKIYYHKFKDFCRPACYVDEHYFPTMLSIQTPHLLGNRSLTWTDWSGGGAHPATFGKADVKEDFFKRILEGKTCSYNNQPTNLCYLFARKFAPSTLEPLLSISSKVFGF